MANHIILFLTLVATPLFAYDNLGVEGLPDDFWEYDAFNHKQIQKDSERLKNSRFTLGIRLENPTHRYFLVGSILDIATTHRAVSQGYAEEANPFLPDKPALGELIAHKLIVTYLLDKTGAFDEGHEDIVYFMNTLLTLALINNTYIIIKNE